MRVYNWLIGFGASLIAFAMIALPAGAQAQVQRLRGTIVDLDGRVLTVATRDGPQVKILLDEKYSVGAVKKVDLSAIAPGTFVGIAADPMPGGGWKAIEVLLFPESGRGSGEGHYPWDLTPDSSMTNATVTAVVTRTDGHMASLKYKDGSVDILIPDGIPLVTFTAADRSDVKPGAFVLLGATKQADGTLTATRLTVEKDGVKPPM
jgi:hypothetical protein